MVRTLTPRFRPVLTIFSFKYFLISARKEAGNEKRMFTYYIEFEIMLFIKLFNIREIVNRLKLTIPQNICQTFGQSKRSAKAADISS